MVERGIEAGNLRHPGEPLEHEPDGGEIVRLVQRGERFVTPQPLEDARVDPRGRHELESAVHHAVPDTHDALAVKFGPQEIEQDVEGLRVIRRGILERAIHHHACATPGQESRRGPEARHLPAQLALEPRAAAAERAELDAR